MRLHWPAAERNREPIGSALEGLLDRGDRVLEIGSGSGQHVVAFAARFPEVRWQPSDPDPEHRASIAAWIEHQRVPNVWPPLDLDVTAGPLPPPPDGARGWDAIYCANVVHISPWAVTLALMAGSAAALGEGGTLVLYGPFLDGSAGPAEDGDGREADAELDLGPDRDAIRAALRAPSNREFDASLRARDPSWGVRRLPAVAAAARRSGLGLTRVRAMPANNLLVAFARLATPRAPTSGG